MPPHHRAYEHVPQKAEAPVRTFLRLLGLLRGQGRRLALLLPGQVATTAAGLVWPWVLGRATDLVASGPVAWGRLSLLLLGGLAATGTGCLAQVFNGRTTVRLSVSSVVRMRRGLFAALLRLPVSRYDETRHGEFMSRLTNDTASAGETLGQGILQFLASCLSLAFTLAFMCALSWRLTLVACSTLPLTFLAGRFLVRVSRRLYRARQAALGEVNAYAEEMISGQHTVQAFCREAAGERAFGALSDRVRRLALRAEMVGGVMGPVMNAIGNLNYLLVAAFGGWFVLHGQASVGLIITFLLYARQFGRPVNEIANQFGQIQSAIAGAERVFRTMDLPPEEDAGRAPFDPAAVRGAIRFEGVRFRYGDGPEVIRDFSLDVPAGARYALVGETGSGKTTLISLLARFHDPTAGRITLDGTDLRDLPKPALRRSLAIVLQDVRLFTGTVAENVAYGRPDAPRADIEAACRLANADAFIRRLPKGYDTVINQTDTALSQGQCQLLSIARAALADPRILVLDEATSSVDTLTELRIQEAMGRLMKGRTSIVIAHRLSTVRDADCIVVLDAGRIVGRGTHAELLRDNAPYRRLCGASGSAGAGTDASPISAASAGSKRA